MNSTPSCSAPSFRHTDLTARSKRLLSYCTLSRTPHRAIQINTSYTPQTPRSSTFTGMQYLWAALNADCLERDSPEEHVERGLLEVKPRISHVPAAVEVELAQRGAPLQHAPHDGVVHLGGWTGPPCAFVVDAWWCFVFAPVCSLQAQ